VPIWEGMRGENNWGFWGGGKENEIKKPNEKVNPRKRRGRIGDDLLEKEPIRKRNHLNREKKMTKGRRGGGVWSGDAPDGKREKGRYREGMQFIGGKIFLQRKGGRVL